MVDTIAEIQEDDWSYLEDTKENKITLITCIKISQLKDFVFKLLKKFKKF